MADQVTPSVEKTPEDIEREMAATRESITEKVAALENQVVGTVQTAADTISETVAAVKSIVSEAPTAVTETVKHAAEAVSESVRDTFDITGHVRRNPLTAVGSAALAGCIAGWLLSSRRASLGAPAGYVPAAAGAAPLPAAAARAPEPARAADSKPGIFDELFGMLGDRAKELARTALESVSAALKQTIQEGAPKLVDEAASRLTGSGAGSESATFGERFDARRTTA